MKIVNKEGVTREIDPNRLEEYRSRGYQPVGDGLEIPEPTAPEKESGRRSRSDGLR